MREFKITEEMLDSARKNETVEINLDFTNIPDVSVSTYMESRYLRILGESRLLLPTGLVGNGHSDKEGYKTGKAIFKIRMLPQFDRMSHGYPFLGNLELRQAETSDFLSENELLMVDEVFKKYVIVKIK